MRSESDVIETVESADHPGFRALIYHDEDPSSPADWDQVGTLITWHRSYKFQEDGRKHGEPVDWLEQARFGPQRDWLELIPVGMYDHSGISLYEGGGRGWDSGQVGFLYTSFARYRELCVEASKTEAQARAQWRKKAREILRQELKTWDQFVTGDVYVVVVKGPDDEVRETCGGFYGIESAREEAVGQIKMTYDHEQEQKQKIERMMAL